MEGWYAESQYREARVVVRAVGSDLDDVFLLGRERDTELRMNFEADRCHGVAKDRGGVVVGCSGRVENGPRSRVDVVFTCGVSYMALSAVTGTNMSSRWQVPCGRIETSEVVPVDDAREQWLRRSSRTRATRETAIVR